ncbi:MAG: lytic transglycosylase domain-containing protein [Gammaproteobacteria bacterium]|nr:lytic transglycosylase domain-containing protein [Gammaproteobacteria bacterium]
MPERRGRRSAFAARTVACAALLAAVAARAQSPPTASLVSLLHRIARARECYTDAFSAEVWHQSMEPRLRPYVHSYAQRIKILDDVYCEARRDPRLPLPPGLVLALIAVESHFHQYAVSKVGAVGMMQVMPFWPRRLGVPNRLVRVGANIRIGCRILRHYLREEHHDWIRALERYNGSDGHIGYPALVLSNWQRGWRF